MRNDIQAVSIQDLISALFDEATPFAPRYLYRLSDLEGDDLNALSGVWADIPSWRRKALMEDVEELGEKDNLLDFKSLALIAIKDADPETRLTAVHALWEFDSTDLVMVFLGLLKQDPDVNVRAAAASGLGRFVYLGEVDDLPNQLLEKIVVFLSGVVQGGEEDLVRRRSLESLGYSERDEIPEMIRKAFLSPTKEWTASALVAMGRSADKKWSENIITSFDSKMPLVRCEAARAAGRLNLDTAIPRLVEMLDDPDDETREAAVLALAQIGGPGVRSEIEELFDKSSDDFDEEFIQTALDLLAFTEETALFPIFDLSEYEEDEDFDYND